MKNINIVMLLGFLLIALFIYIIGQMIFNHIKNKKTGLPAGQIIATKYVILSMILFVLTFFNWIYLTAVFQPMCGNCSASTPNVQQIPKI